MVLAPASVIGSEMEVGCGVGDDVSDGIGLGVELGVWLRIADDVGYGVGAGVGLGVGDCIGLGVDSNDESIYNSFPTLLPPIGAPDIRLTTSANLVHGWHRLRGRPPEAIPLQGPCPDIRRRRLARVSRCSEVCRTPHTKPHTLRSATCLQRVKRAHAPRFPFPHTHTELPDPLDRLAAAFPGAAPGSGDV